MTAATSKMLMVPDGRMVALRPGTKADAAGLIAHTEAVLADGTEMCRMPDESAMTIEEQRRWIEAYESDPKRLLLVAEAEGKIIGVLDFRPLLRRMLEHTGEFGMSIQAAWRAQGVGTALLEGLLDWARRVDGLRKITLAVRADNAPAIALYERQGFQEEGRRVGQIRLPDGSHVDELLMFRAVP